MDQLIEAVLAVSPHIRYVAVYRDGELRMRQRDGIGQASAAESDRYEELIVNPTLLKLLRQRGDIDCGGLSHVIIRYGNFYQLVLPLPDGHLSVAVAPEADPVAHAAAVAGALGPV